MLGSGRESAEQGPVLDTKTTRTQGESTGGVSEDVAAVITGS